VREEGTSCPRGILREERAGQKYGVWETGELQEPAEKRDWKELRYSCLLNQMQGIWDSFSDEKIRGNNFRYIALISGKKRKNEPSSPRNEGKNQGKGSGGKNIERRKRET